MNQASTGKLGLVIFGASGDLAGDRRPAGPGVGGERKPFVVTVAGAELLAAAERTGLDPEVAFSTLARYAPGLTGRRDGYLHGHHSPAMYALRDLLKDLDLGLGLFHRSGATTPPTAVVRELVADSARTAASLDISAITSRYATESRPAEVGTP